MSVADNIRLLALFNFFSEFRLYAPIAILYFSEVSGSYALGMSIYSVSRLAQAIFEVPTGMFSDLIGRKKTLVLGAMAALCSLMFYAIGGSYLVLIIGGIFEGLTWALYSGNNNALLYDTLAETGQLDRYQEYLGKVSSAFQLALGIASIVGSLIAAFSFQLVMWVSVIPMVLAFLVTLRMVEPKVHAYESTSPYAHLFTAIRQFIRNPRLRVLSIATILKFAFGESSWLFRSTFIEKLWPIWAIGIAQMIGNLCASASYYFAGRLIRRFSEFRLLVYGMSIVEATNLFGLLVPTIFSPALMAANSIFYGVNQVAVNGLQQREFTNEQRATMGSLISLAESLVFAIFSFSLGALADRIGVIDALVVVTLLNMIPMLLYWWLLRPRRLVQT